jgi:hypothetical protein
MNLSHRVNEIWGKQNHQYSYFFVDNSILLDNLPNSSCIVRCSLDFRTPCTSNQLSYRRRYFPFYWQVTIWWHNNWNMIESYSASERNFGRWASQHPFSRFSRLSRPGSIKEHPVSLKDSKWFSSNPQWFPDKEMKVAVSRNRGSFWEFGFPSQMW